MSQVWHRRISQAAQAAAFPEKIQDVFALAHNAWAKEMHFEELGKINKDVFLQHGCSIHYFRKNVNYEAFIFTYNNNYQVAFCKCNRGLPRRLYVGW